MPTYQYACTACGHRFEAVQSFTDASLTDCPECAGRLRKVFSSVGIVFKGSGFYRTDSRNGESSAKDGAEKTGEKTGDKAGANASGGKDGGKDGGTIKESSSTSTNGSSSTSSESSSKASTSTPAPAKA